MEDEVLLNRSHEKFFLAALVCGGLMGSFNASNIYISLPAIMQYFDVGMGMMQLVILGFLVANCLIMPVTGYLMDRFSGKWLYLIGSVMMLAASILCMIALNFWVLTGARVLQGCGGGILVTASMALVYQFIPPQRQLMAVAITGALFSVGVALAPSLSGFFVHFFGWRSIFAINIPVLLLAIFFTIRYVPYRVFPAEGNFDVLGLLTVTIGTVALLIGFHQGNYIGWLSPITVILLSMSVLFLVFLFGTKCVHPIQC